LPDLTHCQLYVTGPLDGLSLRIKIAAYGGLFLSLPVILWELWRFITPGLHAREKRYAVPFVGSSLALFSIGVALAYVTFPMLCASWPMSEGRRSTGSMTPISIWASSSPSWSSSGSLLNCR